MDTSPRLELPYLLPNQAQKHVTHNEALRRLDAVVQLAASDRNLTAPPASPAQGECWLARILDEGVWCVWSGFAGEEMLQNIPHLGIGKEADAANPFAARLNEALWSALFTGDGGDGDLRYTLNKDASANVLSLPTQSGWSGHAEIGLLGDDDLQVKISADGTAWKEALSIGRADGQVHVAQGIAHPETGSSVAQYIPSAVRET